MMPAVILSKQLNIPSIKTIRISSYNSKNEKSYPVMVNSNLNQEIKNSSILCVDDIIATGETFEIALKEINKFNPKKVIFVAPIVSAKVCKKYPDYYGFAITRNESDFIELPWD